MAKLVRSSMEYNQRKIIILGASHQAFTNQNYSVLQVPKLTIYNIVQKYANAENSKEGSAYLARQSHSRERTANTLAVTQRAYGSFWKAHGLLLSILPTILGVSEATMH